jgi:tetratricopeptide (TPR) repeat protein
MSQDGGNAMVRVDSPSDAVFLEPGDPLLSEVKWVFSSPAAVLPPSFDHKAHGNSLLKKKKYLLAIKAYSDGLAASPSDEQKLLLLVQRSQAHLHLNAFASAYRDSTSVLDLLDNDVNSPPQTKSKAVLRQARALEGLKKYDLALEAYEKVLSVDADSSGGKDGKKRTEKMLRESKTGDYDWSVLEKGKVAKEGHSFDIGDFMGPIKVVELSERGGGRGVVTTRDVDAGELLLGALSSFLLSSSTSFLRTESSLENTDTFLTLSSFYSREGLRDRLRLDEGQYPRQVLRRSEQVLERPRRH